MDRVKYMHRNTDVLEDRPPRHGDNWGRWTLNGKGAYWSLDIKHYYINLNGVTTNAQMNDWIFQLAGKTWIMAEDLGNLIWAFDDIFSPQATMCGSGADHRLPPNWVNGNLGEPLGETEDEQGESQEVEEEPED